MVFFWEVYQFQLTFCFSRVVHVFTRIQLAFPAPTQAGSVQLSSPPPPFRGEIFPLFILPPVLFRGVQSVHQLHWTLWFPPRAVLLTGLQIHLGGIGSALGLHWQAGVCGSVSEQVQDVPNACRIHSIVLCIAFVLFQDRKKKPKRKMAF
jgi:hypothetical protein